MATRPLCIQKSLPCHHITKHFNIELFFIHFANANTAAKANAGGSAMALSVCSYRPAINENTSILIFYNLLFAINKIITI